MQVKQEKYNLGQSSVVKLTESALDLKLDVKLTTNANKTNIGATISGIVRDANNNPIVGAIVKLMDNNFKPLYHVTTEGNGKYSINIVAYSSSYNMEATFPGRLASQISTFSLQNGEVKNINFTIYDDPNSSLGVISGELYDNNSLKAIVGAVISLYNINDGNKLIAITYTDNVGEFIFTELPIGNYNIKFSSLGYISLQVATNIQSGQITILKKFLNIDPKASNGIVSGIVTNDFNMPVTNADVILYSVDKNNITMPVAFTTTNSLGVYTFINVPIGNYIVKSNQSQLLDLNSTTTLPNSTVKTSNLLTNTMFNFLGESNILKASIGFDTSNKKLIVRTTNGAVNTSWVTKLLQ